MEDAFLRYRLATRLARTLREAARPLPLPALGEALGLRGPVERVVRPLLDGRFVLEREVGLWEWRYPFPPKGEAVVVLDLETTGLAPGLNEIIEVALVRLEGEKRIPFQSLVRPERPPSPFIERLTGIRAGMLEEAPPLEAVLERAYPLLSGATLVVHNAAFDLSFLRPALEGMGYRLENPVVDSVRLARRAFRGLKRYGLDALSEVLEFPKREVHRALDDVERTLAVVYEVYYMLTSGSPRPLEDLGR
ncbi:PolC-type DNA polymerase III [Thermus brockianus]|uniref:DNA polymerase III subunit epsilon n=1 Tax=Thermus brockianus TaxID=56956 RepID=A0ABM7XJM0_THEBO|nr:3'-5' exonuclease [Thermus brockianus]BDG16506.1 DNA polymerase III subunit epsilon [Thermus brockianus]